MIIPKKKQLSYQLSFKSEAEMYSAIKLLQQKNLEEDYYDIKDSEREIGNDDSPEPLKLKKLQSSEESG